MASIQDNNNSELDTALVDRAWTQMHQQLEVAMPQRKRRGFVWWWAFFALVGISLLAFFLWPTMNNTQNEEPGSGKEVIIADASQPTNDQDTKDQLVTSNLSTKPEPPNHQTTEPPNRQTTEPSNHQTTEPPNHQTTEPSNHQTTEPPNRPTIKPPNHQTTQPSNHQTTKPPNHQTIKPPNHQTTEPSNHQTTKPPNHQTTEPSNHQTTKPPNHQTTKPFNRIPTINHQVFPYQSSLALSHEPSIAAKQSPWSYYLETQAGFSLGDAMQNGLSIGGGVQRSLTNKIKLEAGLQYQWQRSSLLLENNSDDIPDTEALFDTIFPSPAGAYSPALSTVARDLAFNKLNLYVGGNFQVKPRLSLGLGGQASYFTQAYVVFDAGELALAQGGAGDLDGNTLDLYGGDVSVYERVANTNTVEGPYVLDVRRWQLSVNTSIRYRFARHWETGLQYQAHLTSWPNQNLTFGGSSTVQLGLRYYLR